MHWLTILFIGIAANLDNLGISVSYGLKSTRIPFISNFLIALISMVFAFLSITAGAFISHFIPLKIANLIGGFIIIFLGAKSIYDYFHPKLPDDNKADSNLGKVVTHPDLADLNEDKVIAWKESILLGMALAINCLALGLGAGISGISPFFTTISIGLFSILSISWGLMIGKKVGSTRIGRYSNIGAGLLLMIIGIYEILF